ncbi:tyrosine-type recombinase/integrase [Desulfosporosinus lacus]|uniref:Integrase/recombinase XerD n=1 Tax=Desulfosporosinus lacus DSM 15449 TaxID=1121420 RepID=A0A1M5UY84_9FIRM|nr:tyrosine-type recombinase/integrase [Desulfosporosinus lacus]SHH67955.1 integrase/recombinase XerD [Desulfosporosinus lacus DSM 15449]
MDFFSYHPDFLTYIIAKGHSSSTATAYGGDANCFRKFLKENGLSSDVSEIDQRVIRRYIVWLKARKNKPNTMKRKLDSLSSFFNYLELEDIIVKNPMGKVERIKKQIIPRTFLREDEATRLIYVVDNWDIRNKVRNQAFFRVFLYTGLRVSEICAIDWSDIDFKNKTLAIKKAKGNKCRIVFLNDELCEHLWAYLQTRLPLINKALFFNRYNNRMRPKNANKIIRQYTRKAGIDKYLTAHILRHTFATILVQKGVDIITIRDLLDHKDVSTTQIYTHSTEDRQRDALQQLQL